MAESRNPKRGRPKASDTVGKEIILSHALVAFAQRGYDGVSIRDLANETGMNVALTNYHFGSKQELWQACVDVLVALCQPSVAKMRKLLTGECDYYDRLISFVDLFIELSAQNPNLSLFIGQEAVRRGQRQVLVSRALIAPFHEIGVALLTEGMENALILRQDPSLIFFMAVNATSNILSGQSLIGTVLNEQIDLDEMSKKLRASVLGLICGLQNEDVKQRLLARSNP